MSRVNNKDVIDEKINVLRHQVLSLKN